MIVLKEEGKKLLIHCSIDNQYSSLVNNNMIGGVDCSNQMRNSHPVERKRLKKWYKKM